MEKDKHQGTFLFNLDEEILQASRGGENHRERGKDNISLLEARRQWNDALKILMKITLKLQTIPYQTGGQM